MISQQATPWSTGVHRPEARRLLCAASMGGAAKIHLSGVKVSA